MLSILYIIKKTNLTEKEKVRENYKNKKRKKKWMNKNNRRLIPRLVIKIFKLFTLRLLGLKPILRR